MHANDVRRDYFDDCIQCSFQMVLQRFQDSVVDIWEAINAVLVMFYSYSEVIIEDKINFIFGI